MKNMRLLIDIVFIWHIPIYVFTMLSMETFAKNCHISIRLKEKGNSKLDAHVPFALPSLISGLPVFH